MSSLRVNPASSRTVITKQNQDGSVCSGARGSEKAIRVRAQRLQKSRVVLFARRDEPIQACKLCAADGRLHVGRLEVVAEVAVHVLVVVAVRQTAELLAEAFAAGVVLPAGAVAVTAPVTDRPGDAGQLLVVGEHHPALARRDVMRRVEGQGGESARTCR